jgi:glycosyltransferase involved in cell wall biosynthesis
MRFCMVTTFFGAQSFGGDAEFVDRLSRALLRRGHEVAVVHCADAFEALRGDHPLRSYVPPPGLEVHTLRSRVGPVSPLWTHQTGRPGPKAGPLRRILGEGGFDVVHFHNVSLVGGPGVFDLAPRGAVRLMTAHEHWLVCPTSLLWKNGREPCRDAQCARCTLRSGRPVQLWRRSAPPLSYLDRLDGLIFPSRHAAEVHRRRGLDAPHEVLGYFVPEDWAVPPAPEPPPARPYVVAAGRLVRAKGFEALARAMVRLPELDLVLAGAGPEAGRLRRLSQQMPNVRMAGLVDPARLRELYAGALAAVVPSLFYETFGYVVLEAASAGTPAVVRRRGALPEVVDASGGGLVYDDDAGLVAALRRLASEDDLRRELGARALASVSDRWSEDAHIERYLELIDARRSTITSWLPSAAPGAKRATDQAGVARAASHSRVKKARPHSGWTTPASP